MERGTTEQASCPARQGGREPPSAPQPDAWAGAFHPNGGQQAVTIWTPGQRVRGEGTPARPRGWRGWDAALESRWQRAGRSPGAW